MNCFEARTAFVPFWRRALAPERCALLLAHLRECTGCDHSFRLFALTAPLLYSRSRSEPVPDTSDPELHREISRDSGTAGRRFVRRTWSNATAAFTMAAAAAIALYFAAPPRVTFEDAIAADNPGTEFSGSVNQSTFGQGLIGQETGVPDASYLHLLTDGQNDFAG